VVRSQAETWSGKGEDSDRAEQRKRSRAETEAGMRRQGEKLKIKEMNCSVNENLKKEVEF